MPALRIREREERDRPAVERSHPALVAERDGELAGVLTYVVVERVARRAGCTRLWLIDLRDELELEMFLGE